MKQNLAGLLFVCALPLAAQNTYVSITTSCPLPDATAGLPYSVQFNASPASLAPYSWTFQFSANTPDTLGLTFPSTGLVSGTPTQSGSLSFTVQATGTGGVSSAIIPCSVRVLPAALGFVTSSLPNATAGQLYNQTVVAAGGMMPYTFRATGLPSGLAMNSGGVITGTTNSPGQYLVGVTVYDSGESSASKTFLLTVDPPFSITTASLPDGSVGQSYYVMLFTSPGGALPYSYYAMGLPSGLTMTTAGVLSGTPSQAGVFPVDVQVYDATNKSASMSYQLTIHSQPAITTSSLPAAMVGQAYKQTLSASGGVGPYSYFILSGAVPGLKLTPDGVFSGMPSAAGNYSLNFQVIDQLRNNSSRTLTLTVNASTAAPIMVSPLSLQFSSTINDAQGPQSLTITAPGTAPVAFSLTLDDGNGGPAPMWLKVSSMKGQTPGAVRVSQVVSMLGVGTYSARIRFTSPAMSSPIDVPVTLMLSNPAPKITVSPTILTYNTRADAPKMLTQTVVVTNMGGGGPMPLTFSQVGRTAWVRSIMPMSAMLAPGKPVTVNVAVDSTNFQPSLFRDALRITSPLGSIDVPLDLVVMSSGASLVVPTKGVRFATQQGNTTSRTETIPVKNYGSPGSMVNWTAQVLRGADIVTLIGPSGTATPTNPGSFGIKLSSTAAATPGAKSALVSVTDPQAQGSPQFISIVADVAPSMTSPVPDPDPEGMAFVANAGAVSPAPQMTTVNTTSASAVAFVTSTSTDDGAPWLSASPQNGTTSQGAPAQVMVSVNPSMLSPGLYTGQANIGIGSAVRTLDITFLVKAAGPVASFGESPRDATCAPASMVLTQTGIVDNFSIPAGFPAGLTAQMSDNCGTPLTGVALVATFSNGDPPLAFNGDPSSALYAATWQPGVVSPQMTITLTATAPNLATAQMQIAGAVNPNNDVLPSQAIAGLLNNFSPIVGAGLAPGTVTAVFGNSLVAAPQPANTAPLPTLLNGVEVLVSGRNAPIYYVSPNQVNIQIPSELPANKPAQLVLAANNKFSLPQDIFLNAVAPGILTFDGTTLVAQHGANPLQLVDAGHPAKPGETLVMYLVGMGPTSPAVASGAASPTSPLAQVTPSPQVTVGGQNATVAFAGLSPGFVGLYQVNFVVPPTAQAGSLPVVLTQGSISSNTTQLLVGN